MKMQTQLLDATVSTPIPPAQIPDVPHVFSMSCKVTAVNGDLATPEGRDKAIAWWRKYGFTKIWLESYRHGEYAPTERLVEDTRMSFFEGMRFARAGHHLYEISAAIGAYAAERGYGVVEELCGHGIGTHLHEPPQIPNYRQKGRGILLVPGMVLAIEPMINLGTKEIEWMSDGWTVRTADREPSAHYENTVLITDGDPELLTCTGFDERELIRTMHA